MKAAKMSALQSSRLLPVDVARAVFKPVPDLYRGAECPVLYVRESFFTPTSEEIIRGISNETDSLEQWILSSDITDSRVLFFILHEAIPKIYSRQQIVQLARLARIQHPIIRDFTLHSIQLLLLSQSPIIFSTDELRNTEICLFHLLSEVLTSHDDATVYTLVTYLLALVTYIMTCHEEENDEECDRHLTAITDRDLFKELKEASEESKRKLGGQYTDEWITVLHMHLSQWEQEKCTKLNDRISASNGLKGNGWNQPNKEAREEFELLLLISTLIKLNREWSSTLHPQRMLCMIQKFKEKDFTRKSLKVLSANISIYGLCRFLEQEIRPAKMMSSRTFTDVINEAMALLSHLILWLDNEDQTWVLGKLTMLLLHHNEHIRKQSTKLYNLDGIHACTTSSLWKRLLETTQHLLCPMLHDVNADKLQNGRFGWTVIKHNFGGDENHVLTHVLCPSIEEHQNEICCSLKDERLNELLLLEKLNHPHIVQLQAFNDSCWPQFYITEDYLTCALQTTLVNKSRNGHFFSLTELIIFLMETMEGVQYIHNNNIVHRDLTAANVFISASRQVKLSGLIHAREVTGDTITDYKCSFIPTRWSAPESLKRGVFSKMSDMWMIGHLLYEVLTHGRLPYSEMKQSDTELMPMVVDGRRRLCEEACIPGPVRDLIVQLTTIQTSSRLAEVKVVSDVLHTLPMQDDLKNATFPDISREGEGATEHKKGPVTTVNEMFLKSSDNMTRTVIDLLDDHNIGQNDHLLTHQEKFTEACQEDFCFVLPLLTKDYLPGIPQLIAQPKTTLEGTEISFVVMAENGMCSLEKAVETRWLGNSIDKYIECLERIASVIATLHARRLVLCDFSADMIYIEKDSTSEHLKNVWIASIANMRILQECTDEEDQHKQMPQHCKPSSRMAPEVVMGGHYSPSSDVFCFGHLMSWLFDALYKPKDYIGDSMSYHSPAIPESKIERGALGARSLPMTPCVCTDEIYGLMAQCLKDAKSERISIESLLQNLPRLKESHLTGSHCNNSIEDDTSSYKPISLLLNEENKNTYAQEILSNNYLHKNDSKQKVVSTEEDSNIFHMSERFKNTPCEEHTKNMVSFSDDALDDFDRNNTSYSPMRQVPSISKYDVKKKALPSVLEGEKLIDILSNKLPTYERTIIPEPGIDFQWPSAIRGNPPVDASLKYSSFEGFSPLSSCKSMLPPSVPFLPDTPIFGDQECIRLSNQEKKCVTENPDSNCPVRKKGRSQSAAVKEYLYDVEETLCNLVNLKEIKERSGAKLSIQISKQPGKKTFAIRGTRSQIQKALEMLTTRTGIKDEVLAKALNDWLHWVENSFPDLERRAHFLPPVCMRRVPTSEDVFANQKVFLLGGKHDSQGAQVSTPLSVQESDMMDDEALQRVLFNLTKFSTIYPEVFMCLSQFPFGSYLGEQCFYPASSHLPLPTNLDLTKKVEQSCRQGDFDVLLIHRVYGFVIIEIKAVGYNIEKSTDKRLDVAKKLKQAVTQLDKAKTMLEHLVSDIAPGVRITKFIACPNLQTYQLHEVLNINQNLLKDLHQCSERANSADVSSMILCDDHLYATGKSESVNDTKMKNLLKWWNDFIAEYGPDPLLQSHPDLYKKLIARFCGPASTVKVRCITEPRVSIKTLDQAVAIVGDCYTAHIVLHPKQLKLLQSSFPRVFIAGPPGTGKTVVLLLKATEWLLHGNNVCILSTWERSVAAAFMMYHLLKHTLSTQLSTDNPGSVEMLKMNIEDDESKKSAIFHLTQAASKGPLCVIADEVGPIAEFQSHIFPEFCDELVQSNKEQCHILHLWAASCQHNIAPVELQDSNLGNWEIKYFTKPLRSPPSVIREVERATEIRRRKVLRYTERGVPDHTDGPPVKWMNRICMDHDSEEIKDCLVCGRNVASFLYEELRLVKSTAHRTVSPTTDSCSDERIATPNLEFKDVMILYRGDLREDSAIIMALLEAGVPVKVMKESDIEDVATASSNVLWAARQHLVNGLEKKVVVCLGNYEDNDSRYPSTRLQAMSRCSSQLVVVCPETNGTGQQKLQGAAFSVETAIW
ncbi:uncharacterized protein LOC112567904 isoform X2 [Pomacea canaliculata]|uniref:uncharacterized protein LOC112567904 isoform X2 n=1 Tax=Pomacea canaliculata TaxID=400727 RepID=UPI000D72D612|nr:uncharacterized protein LOC112567904 isoform X2 [Pomacea canaliculata]